MTSKWVTLIVVIKLNFGLKLSLCGFGLLAVMAVALLSWQGRLHSALWFKTNGGNEKIGTSADWNHIRSQSKCKLAWNILLIKSKCDHFDSGGQTSKKMFLELYLGHCGFGGRPETKRMCASSSGRYFLILNGCWLLAFCVSWKKLDKAGVWAQYFSSQGLWIMCDSQRDEAVWAARPIASFLFQPQRKTKTSPMEQNMFVGDTAAVWMLLSLKFKCLM